MTLSSHGDINIYIEYLNYMGVSMQGNQDLIPSVLTLALNDAVTYDKVSYILYAAFLNLLKDFEK